MKLNIEVKKNTKKRNGDQLRLSLGLSSMEVETIKVRLVDINTAMFRCRDTLTQVSFVAGGKYWRQLVSEKELLQGLLTVCLVSGD